MITTIVLCFVILLVIGTPIAILMVVATAVALALHSNTSLLILPQQLFNALDNSVLLAIPFFILAGALMAEGAIARKLIAVVNVFVGRLPGGLAIATTSACLFFAAISGSSPATVVAIGSIMIPALIKSGYDERFSIGLTTASGSLGIVIPPSIPMILYCLVMNASIAEIFMAGVLPGLLIGSIFIAYTIALAYKHQWFFGEPVSLREGLRAVRDGLWGLILPVLVLGGIYTGMFTPTEAAAVSVVYALFVELVIYREMKLADVPGVCKQGAILASCLLFILACAMTLIWLLTAERIPHQVADLMTTYIGNRWLFLLLVNILFLLFGCIGDNVSTMMILAPLFAETLVRFEIDPIHFGIISVLLIEYGFLTPPFGINLFVAMGLTKKSLTEVSLAVWPFLVLLLLCVLLVTYIPWISLVLPETFLR